MKKVLLLLDLVINAEDGFIASVHCCLKVTCWERADLLAPVCDV